LSRQFEFGLPSRCGWPHTFDVTRASAAERTQNRLEAQKHWNTMTPALPSAIAAFFRAHNTGETDDFNELFTGDAFVCDEEQEYRDAAIKTWMDGAIAKYQPIADVTELAEAGGQTIATAQVSGNFPGSPVQLRYKFTLRNGKIAALTIGP
jgi:hypothetical protein